MKKCYKKGIHIFCIYGFAMSYLAVLSRGWKAYMCVSVLFKKESLLSADSAGTSLFCLAAVK